MFVLEVSRSTRICTSLRSVDSKMCDTSSWKCFLSFEEVSFDMCSEKRTTDMDDLILTSTSCYQTQLSEVGLNTDEK